ncbi:unnamed protein product [Rhodiola kirilowii]
MSQPEGFIDKNKSDHVCLLKKSIYGLKQSPRQWNKKFDSCMINLGFIRSKYDTCLYLKRVKHEISLYVLLYVDDLLIISASMSAINDTKSGLQKHFDMKDLGPAQKILGVKIIRDRPKKQITLSQTEYIDKVLEKFAMTSVKPSPIPLGGHIQISKDDCPKNESDKQKMANIPYDVAVGSIMYAMLCTRPDLAFGISVLSRYMSNPGLKHWDAMKYMLKYLFGTKTVGLVYCKHADLCINGFVDSDYASNRDNRKSTTAFFFTWAGNCISWKSQLQPIVTLSSTEAEYVAATEAAKEAIWLQGLMKELENKSYVPIIYMDSQSALCICKDPAYHERTKHIDVRLHFIRERIESGFFIVKKISGDTNYADFGTKVIPANKFHFCRTGLHIQ